VSVIAGHCAPESRRCGPSPDGSTSAGSNGAQSGGDRGGDTTASHEITTEGVDLGAHYHDQSQVVTAWVSGGQDGTTARARCTITTVGGQVDVRSIVLAVSQH
jgi:hypothetical protein